MSSRPEARRWAQWALLATPVVVIAIAGWSRRWMSDDGFIHLRVVKQLVAGNGPVFNAGERVEASTSPLWVFLLALADLVTPVRLEWLAVVLGIFLTAAAVVLAVVAAARIHDPGDRLLVPAGAAVVAALAPTWTYTTSGLEGGLVLVWLGAAAVVLAGWVAGRPVRPAGAVILGLGVLIRPDLGVFSVLFLAMVVAFGARRSAATAWRTLAWALAIPVAYQIFRMGYYGALAPNPALAKEASMAWWSQGWRYLQAATEPYWLWLPLVALAVGAYVPAFRRHGAQADRDAHTRRRLFMGAFVLGGVVHATYVVRVGGDFMHARLLLPSLFALCVPVAVVPLARRHLVALAVVPWALVCGIWLRSADDDIEGFGTGAGVVTTDDVDWAPGGAQRAWFVGPGAYHVLQRLDAAPHDELGDTAVSSYGIGVVGYALGNDVYVLDLLGLADPVTARFRLERRGIPGHEKPLPPAWIAARLTAAGSEVEPDDFPAPGLLAAPLPTPREFDEQVAAARAALECGDLRELRQSYRADLTPGRFVDNFVGALGRWRLRIDRDAEVEAAACDAPRQERDARLPSS